MSVARPAPAAARRIAWELAVAHWLLNLALLQPPWSGGFRLLHGRGESWVVVVCLTTGAPLLLLAFVHPALARCRGPLAASVLALLLSRTVLGTLAGRRSVGLGEYVECAMDWYEFHYDCRDY